MELSQEPSTLLLAVQAAAAVLVHQFGLLHPHVHGPVPLIAVGLPVAQVAVGVIYELNAILHDPLIQAAFARVQAVAVVLVQPSALLHPHVALWSQLLATLDTDVPDVQAN